MMFGVVVPSDRVRVFEFMPGFSAHILKADAVGADGRGAVFGQQGNQKAGVQAAGQQHADRDVGDFYPLAHSLSKFDVHLFHPFFRVASGIRVPRIQLPVAFLFHRTVRVDRQVMPGASFRMERSRVRGAGTTACRLR